MKEFLKFILRANKDRIKRLILALFINLPFLYLVDFEPGTVKDFKSKAGLFKSRVKSDFLDLINKEIFVKRIYFKHV